MVTVLETPVNVDVEEIQFPPLNPLNSKVAEAFEINITPLLLPNFPLPLIFLALLYKSIFVFLS